MSDAARLFALVVVAFAIWTGAGQAGSTSEQAARCTPGERQYHGCHAETLPAQCTASRGHTGSWFLPFLRVPDSPDTVYRPLPDEVYVGGTGVAFFGANGSFAVVCSGETFYHGAASEKAYGFPCRLYRGGQDFSFIGSKVYVGRGFVRVGPIYTNSVGTQFVHAVMGCSGRLQQP